MEKVLPKYEGPATVLSVPASHAYPGVDRETALSATKIRWTATFLTAVVTAVIVAGGLTGAAVIVRDGWIQAVVGRNEVIVCPPASAAPARVLRSDKVLEEKLRREDGSVVPERIAYDHGSNTVLIESPGNVSHVSAASIAVDFDRNVVFVKMHDRDTCIGFDLEENMAASVRDALAQNNGNVIDMTTASMNTDNYDTLGEIPADYVQSSNGAVIRGLCAGRTSYWAVPSSGSHGNAAQRLKRSSCDAYLLCLCDYNDNCYCRIYVIC